MKKRIIAVFIAYNESKRLGDFYLNFPKEIFDNIILVDNASKDGTFELAKKLGIHAYQNSSNLGYGGNLKRALDIALADEANIIVDIHPDGEYLPTAILPAIQKVRDGAKFVLGNRYAAKGTLRERGMYAWKLLPLEFMNRVCRLLLLHSITDYHQGFRVYTDELLKQVNYRQNTSGYLFSFELIAQAVYHRVPIAEVPVETIYSDDKRGASFRHAFLYSIGVFKVLGLYALAKLGLPIRLFKTPTPNQP